jgi:hypothetical protein
MKAIITIKRKGQEYLRSLERGGQVVVKDKSISRQRAMDIVSDNGGDLPDSYFDQSPCNWEWQVEEEFVAVEV